VYAGSAVMPDVGVRGPYLISAYASDAVRKPPLIFPLTKVAALSDTITQDTHVSNKLS